MDERFGIHAVATELPEGRASAAALTAALALDPGVVTEKLGLVEKCLAEGDDEHPADFSTRAVERALAAMGAGAGDVGLVIYTGVSRDYLPSYSVALDVVQRLGLERALAYDLSLGCAAPLVAADHARRRGPDGRPPLSVVVTAERWSHTLSPRVPFPLAWIAHADGGAAMVLGPDAPLAVSPTQVHVRADFNRFLVIPAGGTREPPSATTVAEDRHARRVFEKPPVDVTEAYVEGYQSVVSGTLRARGVELADVALLLMNQIRPELRRRVLSALDLAAERTLDSYPFLGHLGGADTLVGLELAARRGLLARGSTLVMAASSVSAFAAVSVDVHGALSTPSPSSLPETLVRPA